MQETRKLAYRQQIYRQPTVTIEEDAEHKRTIATIETHGQPIEALRLVTDSRNFSRRYEFASERIDRRGDPKWNVTGHGTLLQFAVGTLQREELVATGNVEGLYGTTSTQDRRPAKLKLTIENGDSPPLSIQSIEALGPVYELRCLAAPGDQLQLVYGSDDAAAGALDIAALQAALSSSEAIPSATLGEPQRNTAAPKASAATWTPWNDTRVVVGVIVLLTGLLGAGLYQASRRMENFPPPPQEPS